MSNELKVKVIDTIELLKKESANQSVTKAMHNFIDATMAYIDKLELRPTKSKINELIAEPKKQIVINLFKTVLDEATGDLDNPNKRIWPLHSTTYKAIRNLICDEVKK